MAYRLVVGAREPVPGLEDRLSHDPGLLVTHRRGAIDVTRQQMTSVLGATGRCHAASVRGG